MSTFDEVNKEFSIFTLHFLSFAFCQFQVFCVFVCLYVCVCLYDCMLRNSLSLNQERDSLTWCSDSCSGTFHMHIFSFILPQIGPCK